jgi:hypothetical protein
MAQKNFDAITFLDQWTEDTDEESKELELEYFKCGDVLVHSRIVSLDQVK